MAVEHSSDFLRGVPSSRGSEMSKDVELTRQTSGPKKWKLTHPGSPKDDAEGYPVVDLPPNSGPQLVIFTLPNGHKFNQDASVGPIWIDTQKPTSKVIHPDITDWKVYDGGRTLVVLDKNSTKAELHYQLNIKNSHGSADNLDPIIDNGGGTYPPPPAITGSPGTPASQPMDFMGLGIALVIGLVLGFFAHRLFFK
jgi:hypothetical protein